MSTKHGMNLGLPAADLSYRVDRASFMTRKLDESQAQAIVSGAIVAAVRCEKRTVGRSILENVSNRIHGVLCIMHHNANQLYCMYTPPIMDHLISPALAVEQRGSQRPLSHNHPWLY